MEKCLRGILLSLICFALTCSMFAADKEINTGKVNFTDSNAKSVILNNLKVKHETLNYALLIIDMQNDFVKQDSPFCIKNAHLRIPKIKQTIDFFRKNNMYIFHICRSFRKDGSDVQINLLKKFFKYGGVVIKGTKGGEIVDGIKLDKNNPKEYIVYKQRYSAFNNTELNFMLQNLNVTQLVVCGIDVPNCVRMSVYQGLSFGYPVTVLTDATASNTEKDSKANFYDMKNVGVDCLTVEEFVKQYNEVMK